MVKKIINFYDIHFVAGSLYGSVKASSGPKQHAAPTADKLCGPLHNLYSFVGSHDLDI